MSAQDGTQAFLCSFSDDGEGGIITYEQDPGNGALSGVYRREIDGASFLALGPAGGYLYSVNRIDGGTVIAHEINGPDGTLTELNRTSSEGSGPAYISVDGHGDYAFVANYAGGTVAMYPIRHDGGIGPACDVIEHAGSSVDPDRQTAPHPHSIGPGPNDRFVYAPDLGTDEVWIYEIDRDADALVPATPEPTAALHDGAGPRHFAFHPDRPIVYVINELDSTLTTFAYAAETGALSALDRIDTLPDTADEESYCADIHVHPNGRWVYGSNRGHDSIVLCEVDETDGTVRAIDHTDAAGHWPRNFAIDPTGEHLYVENRRTDNIVPFAIDQGDGTLTRTASELSVTEPICLVFRD